MKRFFVFLLIFLQVILLPACQTESTTSNTVLSDAITTVSDAEPKTTAVTESSTQPVAEVTLLSPVRYTIDYEITDIFETYPEINRTQKVLYTKNEQLYISSLTFIEDRYEYHLTVLDAYGVPTEYPLPAFEENGMLPRYVYPLENGRFVLVYSPMPDLQFDPSMSREQFISMLNSVREADRYLAIANADGTLERSIFFTNYTGAEQSISVYEEPSDTGEGFGELFIFARKNLEERVWFNQNLEETPLDNDPAKSRILKYLGNQSFLYGASCYYLRSFQLGNEEIKPYSMRLPSEWEFASVYTDTDGNFYLWDDHGIYRYRDGEQPIKIVDVVDSGLAKTDDGGTLIYILNEEAIYKYHEHSTQLTLYRMKKVPVTVSQATLNIDVMGLSEPVEKWLVEAVQHFNNQNPDYRVKLNSISDIGGVDLREYYRDVIDEMLLYGSHPDMVMTDHVSVLASYYEKGAFLDMSSRITQPLLGCARGIDGDDSTLYQIPFGMQMTTFAVPSANAPQKLTYDAFLSQMEQLQNGQYLTAFVPLTFYDIYADFIDYDAKTSHFNSEEFRRIFLAMHDLQTNYARYMNKFAGELSFGECFINTGTGDSLADYARYGADNQYWTINGTVGTALENGDLKYLSVAFNDLRAYSALKLIFGDTEFSLCGYPSMSGGGASITSILSAAVLWDTEHADGCAAFLNFLLSDSMQNKIAQSDLGLPVTYSAMSTAIDGHRYSLYDETTADAMNHRNTPEDVSLEPLEISAVRLPQFDELTPEEQKRRIVEITEDDKQQLLRFFDDVRPRRQTASIVQSIITEEISYWENNARSLEETTKIIDSRVWIYLNE